MRWKCICSYDGTDFNGWQSQPNGNTIQDVLENRLCFIFDMPVRVHGSGRTDSGVHANWQVFHFDGEWKHGAYKLIRAFKGGLPKAIKVFSAEQVDDDFHARFSATRKRYKYYLLYGDPSPFEYKYVYSLGVRRLDIDKMNSLAEKFLGEHDFRNFGALHDDNAFEKTIKNMYQMQFVIDGGKIIFTTEGSGYLYKMVRIMVGCFLQVGLGKIDCNSVIAALRADSVDLPNFRKECMPASGLFLDKVFY